MSERAHTPCAEPRDARAAAAARAVPSCPPLDAVEHLVGLQAQVPLNPYTALWSRLERFRPGGARRPPARAARRANRRHARDHPPRRRRRLPAPAAADAAGARRRARAPPRVRARARAASISTRFSSFARALLAERPRTGPELRAALAERFPTHDAAALAYACRSLLALVQVPPRGALGPHGAGDARRPPRRGSAVRSPPSRRSTTSCSATSAPSGRRPSPTSATWCRLTGLREVVERLRPRLRMFRDERGRELFDLPDAPRPDPDDAGPAAVPARVRQRPALPRRPEQVLRCETRGGPPPDGPRCTAPSSMTGCSAASGASTARTGTRRSSSARSSA